MNSSYALRPAWTIARSIWLARGHRFAAIFLAALGCGVLFRCVNSYIRDADARGALGYIPMGLSIFLTFVFCNFTENDRRGRLEGFPAHLFALPVSTRTLVLAPILFSALMVAAIYAVWAQMALPALNEGLPLDWPILYLGTGMVCYHAIVWSLARFRLLRLLVLGVGGTILAVGWDAFRHGSERELISQIVTVPENFPIRALLCAFLIVTSLVGLTTAYVAVESQRRGGRGEWQGLRRLLEFIADLSPRTQKRFHSPDGAQFWYEWRRHGMLLPLGCVSVILCMMAPAAFVYGGISASTTTATLGWIVLAPLLMAFTLGKGFGKADLWSKEAGLPLHLATRPLANTSWIGAKIKAAALASIVSWLFIFLLVPCWLALYCDYRGVLGLWGIAERIYSPWVLCLLPVILFGVMVTATWRLLVDGLFVGLSGKTWMITVSSCAVLVVILATPFVVGALTFHPRAFRYLLRLPAWLPLGLAALFAAKCVAAGRVTLHAREKGWVNDRTIRRYVGVWLCVTAFLMACTWLLIPVAGWLRWMLLLACMFAVPLLSMAYAPGALAGNRRR